MALLASSEAWQAWPGFSCRRGMGSQKSQLALEVLKSKKFAYEFATRHDILPELMAAEVWDWEAETLTFDES